MKDPTKQVRRSIWRVVQQWGRDLLDKALRREDARDDPQRPPPRWTEQHDGEHRSRQFPD